MTPTTAHSSAATRTAAAGADPEAAGFSPERLRRLAAALTEDIDAGLIPGGVVLIVRNGILAYHQAFGHGNRAASRPMDCDSIFRIASMTKPLTVVAALMLMERGKLLLTDPVSRYFGEFRDLKVGVETSDPAGTRRLDVTAALRPMTLHDLMRHTAGFTYGQFGDSLVQRAYRSAQLIDNAQTNAEFIAKLAQLPLAYQPGTTFEYGMSTDVLGCVIEKITERSLAEVFEHDITGPLGMVDTGFGVAPDQVARLAEPQREPGARPPGAAVPEPQREPGARPPGAGALEPPRDPAARPPGNGPSEPPRDFAAAHPVPRPLTPAVMPYDPARPAAWHSGGGGLLSTARDYSRFCGLLLGEGRWQDTRLIARKTAQLMLSDHLPPGIAFGPRTADLGIAAPLPAIGQSYGLGVGVRTAAGLAAVPGSIGDFHWGGALGPYFWVDPAEQLIVVFMLQELNVQRRARYRALLRALVYQALK